MPEHGIVYTFVGADGTRAVVNDPTDADFVGYLDSESGVTGLEGADVREEADVLTEEDGGIHGDFFLGRRAVVFQGFLYPDGDVAVWVARENKLKRATKALRADGTCTFKPSGGIERRFRFRRQQRPVFTQRRPKMFQVALVSESAVLESTIENSQVISAGGASGLVGLSSPLVSPLTSVQGQTGQASIVNLGDEYAAPRYRIDGPITNPTIRNGTTGEELRLLYTLAAGEWLDIDVRLKTVLLGGAADRYRAVQFPGSKWWKLAPGSNDVRLLATSYSTPAALTVYWRHTFE